MRAQGIHVRLGREPVLRGVDLELAPGTVTVLLGPNGAGKTTFLRTVLGSLRPEAGTLSVLGLDPLREPRRVRERVAFVPAVPDAPGWMSVAELARFVRAHHPRWSEACLAGMLTALDVPLDAPLARLSRGQAMKATLALALAPDPELVLLDEPFSGLDPLAREGFLRLLVAELAEREATALVATHDLDVAARLADHVAVLQEGRVAARGTAAEILDASSTAGGLTRRLRELLEDAAREEALVA